MVWPVLVGLRKLVCNSMVALYNFVVFSDSPSPSDILGLVCLSLYLLDLKVLPLEIGPLGPNSSVVVQIGGAGKEERQICVTQSFSLKPFVEKPFLYPAYY